LAYHLAFWSEPSHTSITLASSRTRLGRWLRAGVLILHHEESGQCHHGHVPMPSIPLAHLIVGHAKVAFGVLKVALDKVALSLMLG